MIEERDRLRLNLETFLRQKYNLSEQFASVPEIWDTRAVAMMGFRDGPIEFLRAAPIEDFEWWLKEQDRP